MKNLFLLFITIVLNVACAAQTDSVKSAQDYIMEQENKRNTTPNTVKPKPKTLKSRETDKQTKTKAKKKSCCFFCKKKRKDSN